MSFKKRLMILCAIVLVGAAILQNTCAGNTYNALIIWDGNNIYNETIYIVREKQIYAKQSTFPGYGKTSHYLCKNPTPEMLNAIQHIQETQPSHAFIYPGPLYAVICARSHGCKIACLDRSNRELVGHFHKLRGSVIIKQYEINGPPEWVASDQIVQKWLEKYKISNMMHG